LQQPPCLSHSILPFALLLSTTSNTFTTHADPGLPCLSVKLPLLRNSVHARASEPWRFAALLLHPCRGNLQVHHTSIVHDQVCWTYWSIRQLAIIHAVQCQCEVCKSVVAFWRGFMSSHELGRMRHTVLFMSKPNGDVLQKALVCCYVYSCSRWIVRLVLLLSLVAFATTLLEYLWLNRSPASPKLSLQIWGLAPAGIRC
jgi:hypothetical protein